MSKVSQFPRPGERLILDSGIIRGGEIGRRMFWLDFVDKDGAVTVWSGSSKAAALAAANDWTRNGIRLIDKTESFHG